MTLAHVRSLAAFGPAANDRASAVRLAVGVAVPTGLLLLMGWPELTIYAVFGAFTGMYGRNEPRRVQHQLLAALLLVGGVTVGVTAAHLGVSPWGLVAVQGAFAFVGSLYADRCGLTPAGPFFGMFALGASASVASTVAPWLALAVALGAALIGIGIGAFGRVAEGHAALTADLSMRRAVAYLAAVTIAGALSTALELEHPIWAMAAAAVPLAVSGTGNRVRRGTHRIIGTLGGLVLTGAILLPFGSPAPAVLVLLIIVLQFPTELFMIRNYGVALFFFTPLILLMTQLASPVSSLELIADRALQTALGATVGIGVAAFPLWAPRRPA